MELVIQLYTYDINSLNSESINLHKQQRQSEINDCFIRNICNPIFNTVHILLERECDLPYYSTLISNSPENIKCKFTIVNRQPRYSDIVWYIANNINNGIAVCIMNSDIYMGLNISIDYLNKELDDKTLISLTRHEYNDDSHSICDIDSCPLIYKYGGSHDAFIFKTPVPKDYDYFYINHPQNIYGSEAVFMHSWTMVGKELKNICFDIPIYHRHKNSVYFNNYITIATHKLCNIPPTVPEGRTDIVSKMNSAYIYMNTVIGVI
jgi:hypothetical protein